MNPKDKEYARAEILKGIDVAISDSRDQGEAIEMLLTAVKEYLLAEIEEEKERRVIEDELLCAALTVEENASEKACRTFARFVRKWIDPLDEHLPVHVRNPLRRTP